MLKLTDKMNFGKYRDDTVQEVIDNTPSYIKWALDEVNGFELDDEAMAEYEQAIAEFNRDPEEDYTYAHPLDFGDN